MPVRTGLPRLAGATLLILLVVTLEALASSPALHARVCLNASRPGHHCAVTDFAAGLAEAPQTTVAVALVVMVLFVTAPLPDMTWRVAPAFRLSSPRAPPV